MKQLSKVLRERSTRSLCTMPRHSSCRQQLEHTRSAHTDLRREKSAARCSPTYAIARKRRSHEIQWRSNPNHIYVYGLSKIYADVRFLHEVNYADRVPGRSCASRRRRSSSWVASRRAITVSIPY